MICISVGESIVVSLKEFYCQKTVTVTGICGSVFPFQSINPRLLFLVFVFHKSGINDSYKRPLLWVLVISLLFT